MDERQATAIAARLERLLGDRDFDPQSLQPSLVGGQPAGQAGDHILFVLDESVSPSLDQNHELMAIKWVNNLRLAFALEPLDLVAAQQEMYGILETSDEFHGLASWYGPYFHGRLTANGETYDQEAFTAAHPSLPFNTYLKVTNLETDESAIVRINDRGPYIPPRTLDLSRGVARCLNSKEAGVVPYRAVIMEPYATVAGDRADQNM
ncbi:MAG: septal ring lytic transglycosylase RlpA family protein [Spirulinaceae cyanobacterium SM2_1_0]|nr:septal ring lytic transglycosylase RlpA family protein [Spirulinaceae cyanobacterium SM2_1_0]